jgi:hypothetical protein
MNNLIIKQWEENKHFLKTYFANTPQSEYDEYEKIVKKIFEHCIVSDGQGGYWRYKDMVVIDHGDYQGTQLFIIPRSCYQPDINDYIITHNEYGSCSGCDTLLGINSYGNELPTRSQVNEYMTLSLHLVQRMKVLSE